MVIEIYMYMYILHLRGLLYTIFGKDPLIFSLTDLKKIVHVSLFFGMYTYTCRQLFIIYLFIIIII